MTGEEPKRDDELTSVEIEPRSTLDLERVRELREEFYEAERRKAVIMQRLEKIRKLRRRLIGP